MTEQRADAAIYLYPAAPRQAQVTRTRGEHTLHRGIEVFAAAIGTCAALALHGLTRWPLCFVVPMRILARRPIL